MLWVVYKCKNVFIQCIFFCTFLIRMGREVLPLDKDYILDILDDVFFYIKQGSKFIARQRLNFRDLISRMMNFLLSQNHFSSQVSKVWLRVYQEYFSIYIGQIQKILLYITSKSTSYHLNQFHSKFQFFSSHRLLS